MLHFIDSNLIVSILLVQTSLGLKPCKDPFNGTELCTNDSHYDSKWPDFSLQKPFVVNSSITLLEINEIDERRKTMSLNIMVAMWWNDTRIVLRSDNPNRTVIWHELNGKDVFLPTLEISPLKTNQRQRKISSVDVDFFWLRHPHFMEFQQSIFVTIYCSFDFTPFPFDAQVCRLLLKVSDFGSQSIALNPAWIRYQLSKTDLGESKIQVNERLVPFDIKLSTIEPFVQFKAGLNVSACGMLIELKRHEFGLLIGGFYGPTTIFALLSLVSFTIHLDIVPGRLGLLVTLFLITANIYNSVEGPPDRGMSFLEIWMIGIDLPILVAIVQYGVLLMAKRYLPNGLTLQKKHIQIDGLALILDKWTMMTMFFYIFSFITLYWTLLG